LKTTAAKAASPAYCATGAGFDKRISAGCLHFILVAAVNAYPDFLRDCPKKGKASQEVLLSRGQ
jgi:hypothetical protein